MLRLGLAEAAAVIRDDAVTGGGQRADLVRPGLSVQRPAVDQDHWLPGSSGVLVVQLVLVGAGDGSHPVGPFVEGCGSRRSCLCAGRHS
ncbi:hypothetical protein ACFFX0_10020 [Citricoccus parietis]|uniref:Uncharacterized protein n=1 Tax=Citricoccus parietis TaxID=592307 RepID=A0ABV5FXV8_9MICC